MKTIIIIFLLFINGILFSQANKNDNVFIPKEPLVDIRDNQSYKTIQLGNQVWMAENLNFYIEDNSFCYMNDTSYCSLYGRLYNWETAQYACPEGWHLPSDNEWKELFIFLGGSDIAGGKIKEKGTGLWYWQNIEATNNSGFTALPGGCADQDSDFIDIGYYAYFWSSTECDRFKGWSISVKNEFRGIIRNGYHKSFYFSVRCIKDN